MADENVETETTGVTPAEAEAEASSAGSEAAEQAPESRSEEPAEPQVQLSPKERRVSKRTAKAAKVGVKPARTAQERHDERQAVRAQKAKARRTRRLQEREAYQAAEHERQPTPPREHVAGVKKTLQGVVVSDKAAKTITVRIDVARRHRRYQKIVRTSTTVHAHDERGDAHVGDTVVVVESRPLSATKRWRLVEVVERAR